MKSRLSLTKYHIILSYIIKYYIIQFVVHGGLYTIFRNIAIQYNKAQYSTVLYSTWHYSIVKYSTVGTFQYMALQQSTVQYNTVLYSTWHYSRVLYSTVQYSTVHYCAFRCKIQKRRFNRK